MVLSYYFCDFCIFFLTIFAYRMLTHQGCGNTIPDLSDLVPFHSGQVITFHLLVLSETSLRNVTQFCISYSRVMMNTHHVKGYVENSVDPDQLASQKAS